MSLKLKNVEFQVQTCYQHLIKADYLILIQVDIVFHGELLDVA